MGLTLTGRPKALLIDVTKCVGCRACVYACQEEHGLPENEGVTELSDQALCALADYETPEVHVRRLCMHCLTPTCASVCPVGALVKTSAGPVLWDEDRCIGCRYCILACPFNVPKYEWSSRAPRVAKCDMCAERQARGEIPACADACAFGATTFGERDELIAEAYRRMAESPDDYHPHVYGEHEAGGTSVLFLSPVPLEKLGMPGGLGDEPLPLLTWNVLRRVPSILVLTGAVMGAVWWVTKRSEEVARVEGGGDGSHAIADGEREGDDR